MRTTPFHSIHQQLGARIASFSGFAMPIQYEGITAEHETVRKAVGVFDVSHMGEFIIKGKGALDLIQRVSSNDAAQLVDGKVQYAYFPNEQGGIVDDLLIYRIDAQTYMLVVNAGNIEKDWAHLQKHNTFDAELIDISDRTALLAVQGPLAADALQGLTPIDLRAMAHYTFEKGVFADVENVLVSATGYTGSGGFEIYFEKSHAEKIWHRIFEAGAPYGIKPVGLGARDTLRLEMGFCLYGNDINEQTSPFEAGLGWITRFTKDFVNSAALQREKEQGVNRKLVGFEMTERGIPREGYEITDENDRMIGIVTSGTQSPSLKKGIGMGYVEKAFAREGTPLHIMIRGKSTAAQVVKPPFYRNTQ